MNKTLLKSEEDFHNFELENTFSIVGYTVVNKLHSKPRIYPCILIWHEFYDSDGPNYIDGEYVYLDDFVEKNKQ